MAVVSLVLFGSRARGDFGHDSDVDLLVINNSAHMRSKTLNKINVVYYPYDFLCSKSKSGDLFVLHLKLEAKVIFDPLMLFNNLCDKFKYKENYDDDIASASMIGKMLVQHTQEFVSNKQLNKRIAWCVRTILIARSAEIRKPVFSANALCKFAASDDIYDLIKNKDNDDYKESNIRKFDNFLNVFGKTSQYDGTIILREYKSFFKSKNNKMGLKVLRNINSDIFDY